MIHRLIQPLFREGIIISHRLKLFLKKIIFACYSASVTPSLRMPLFWLTFKNTSSKWYCRQVQKCIDTYGYVNIYLHPWEFTDVSDFSLPSYMTTNPDKMREKLIYFDKSF